MKKFEPIPGFCGFLKGYSKLGIEVCRALTVECFTDIGTDAGAAAEELFGENVFFFLIAELAIELYDAKGKLFAFIGDYVFFHCEISLFLLPYRFSVIF